MCNPPLTTGIGIYICLGLLKYSDDILPIFSPTNHKIFSKRSIELTVRYSSSSITCKYWCVRNYLLIQHSVVCVWIISC